MDLSTDHSDVSSRLNLNSIDALHFVGKRNGSVLLEGCSQGTDILMHIRDNAYTDI